MIKHLIIFLTHNFKSIFTETLKNLSQHINKNLNAVVLLDSNYKENLIQIPNISSYYCKKYPSPFDPIGQAHNFYLDFFQKNPQTLDMYDYFWVLENDVYYHGDLKNFFDVYSEYYQDLLVPEYGSRYNNWCWLKHTQGISVRPIGVTAVIYRTSARLMRFMVQNLNSKIKGHIEVVLPHICIEHNFSIQQFIPNHIGAVNTYRTPIIDLVEQDLLQSTDIYIEKNKLYHPIKL